MRLTALFALLVGCWLVAGCQHGPPLSNEQEQRYGEMLRSGKVKMEFDRGASLTRGQQVEVVALAEQCGIKDPAKVSTSINPVTRWVDIVVSSRDRTEGCNRSFDSVWIFKRDWRDVQSISTGKRLGQFSSFDDGPATSLTRRYEFRGTPIEVQIFGDLSMELADEIVSRIEGRKMRFEPGTPTDGDYFERRMSRLNRRFSMSIGSKDGEHQICLSTSLGVDCFIFRLDGPDIVVTSRLHISF